MKRLPIALLLILFGGLLFTAACAAEAEKVVETVVVEKAVPGEKLVEKVVETVVVEKEVAGEIVKVVETVVVEKPVEVEKKVVETVVVEKEVPGEKVVETVIVEKPVEKVVVATPTPTPAEAPGAPSGSVTVAVTIMEAPSGYPGTCTSNCTEDSVQLSVLETLVKVKIGDLSGVEELDPALATAWELDPSLEFVDFTIRKGVPFHDGWGDLTAEDVAFSINAANRATNPDSISGQAGELAAMVDHVEAIDEDTARVYFSVFDARWLRFRFSDFEESFGINSKAVFDKYGADGMRDVIIGTGPFKVLEWKANDVVVMEAVPNHWRRTPSVKTVKVLEVREPSAQLAMMQTGFIAAGRASMKDWPSLVEDYGFVRAEGTGYDAITGIGWCGNYWEWTSARTGEVLERTRDTSLPWVGNPFENGETFDENTPSMQNSLKVRKALSRAIDREGLNQAIQAGLGEPAYFSYQMANDSPLFKQGTYPDGWEIPYDLDLAKQLLDEAGQSGGFDMTIWVDTANTLGAEIMEALAGLWQAELGINMSLERTAYVIFRPSLVQRTNTTPYLSPGDGSTLVNPLSAARGFTMSSWSDGGYGVGMEIPFAADNYVLTAQNPDAQARIDANLDFIQESIDWELCTGIVSTPSYVLINPDIIAAWQFHPISNGAMNSMHNFEYIVLK
jgi:ABC-type transport system substrate-binding protein